MRPFSSDYYDATHQAQVWWPAADNDDVSAQARDQVRNILRSRLRFDHLFTSRISVSRADVLDGACFQHTSPSEVSEWLGVAKQAAPALTVRTRSGNLESDLLRWVKPEGAESLHNELFLLIPPDLRKAYDEGFPKMNPNEIRTASDLARAIGTVVGDTVFGSQLEGCWNQWITGAKYLDIRTVDWSRPDYGTPLRSLRELVPSQDERELYDQMVACFCRRDISRGDLFVQLGTLMPSILPHVNAAIATARAEADGTQHETVMNGCLHRTAYTRLLEVLSDDPVVQGDLEPIDITIPDILAQWLVDCDYNRLLAHTRTRRQAWLENGSVSSLKYLVDAIYEVMFQDPAEPLPRVNARVEGFVRCMAIVGSGAPVLVRLMTSGLDTFLGFDLIPGMVAAASELSGTTGKYVRSAVQSVVKREITAQVVQTFRSRELLDD